MVLLLLSYMKPANALTNKCDWKTVVTSGGAGNTGGCSSSEISASDGLCPQPKPGDGVGSYSTCCCSVVAQTTVSAAKEPLITIPIPEIKIPTVTLTKAVCDPDNAGGYSCAIPWIGEYIQGIYQYGINIVGILAAIVLMAGGLLWLISGGDASKITQAKDMIIGSITGLIILMASYIILTQINPDLVKMRSITMGSIAKQDTALGLAKLGSTSDYYANLGCPTDAELTNGVGFYATGYFKMPWQDTQDKRYLCMVHMQGTCPNGTDTGSDCIENGTPIFSGYPNYQPCKQFTQAQYNSSYFTQANLIVGQTIAGPISCGGKLAMGSKVCFNDHTYTITDSGGGIQGKRIDILSASEADALSHTTTGTLKAGPCQYSGW